MGVTVTLLEITPEIWQEESFQKWISGGVEIGEIPAQVSEFREPKLSDIEAILGEFTDVDFEQTRTGRQLCITFRKLAENSTALRLYQYYEEIYVTSTSPADTSDPFVIIRIDRGSSERIDKFIQLLANRCGTYLLMHNGEPVQFFVPQTIE